MCSSTFPAKEGQIVESVQRASPSIAKFRTKKLPLGKLYSVNLLLFGGEVPQFIGDFPRELDPKFLSLEFLGVNFGCTALRPGPRAVRSRARSYTKLQWLCHTVAYCTTLYYTILYCTVLSCTVLYYIVLCYAMLCYTIIYYDIV